MSSPSPARNQRLLLTSQQLDTVLAAMRFWQSAANAGRVDPAQDSIATDSGEALPVAQYDDFIMSINGAGAEHGTLLDAVVPVLRTSESVEIRVSKDGDALQVLLIPKLAEAQDGEEPGVAAFRALLARPLKAVVPAGEDADAHLSKLLADHAALRDQISSDLDDHRKLLEEAREAAKKARDDAAEKAKFTPAAKAPKGKGKPQKAAKAAKGSAVPTPSSEAAAESDEGAEEAGEGEAVEEAATGEASTAAAEPVRGTTACLFDNLGY